MKLPPSLTALFGKLSLKAPAHDPVRDWLIALLFAIVFLVASVLWNGWFLLSLVAEEAAAPAAAPAAVTERPYDTARTVFDRRADEAKKYASDYRFNDPAK